jgi:RimJ/RimL family protein N-acetyltransferase
MKAATVSLSQARPALKRFEFRPLTADDSPAYFALRQRILDVGDGHYFSDSYTRERQLTTEELRRDWCTAKREHCIMGTLTDKKLVGFTMITQQGPAHSPLVEVEATWLEPDLRGTGLAKVAFGAVRKWIEAQGYKYVVGFIRDDNGPSLRFRTKQGFTYAYTIHDEVWADGSVGNTHAHLLDLHADVRGLNAQDILNHFKEALPFLNQGLHAPPKHHGEASTPSSLPSHLIPTANRNIL